MSDVVYDVILGGTTVRQVSSSTFEKNGTTIYGSKSGATTASAFYGGPAEPQSRIRTTDLYTLLGLSNFFTSGLCVDDGTVIQPWQKRSDCGSFQGGSTNSTVSGGYVHTVPTRISASQDADAEMELLMTWKSPDGITAPYAINDNQSLSASSYIGQYALAECVLNGITIEQMVSVSIDPAMALSSKRFVGNYPKKTYIRTLRPMFELSFEDFDEVYAALTGGGYKAITSAVVYFRKRSGTGFVSDASSAHIALSLSGGMSRLDTLGAQGFDEGEGRLSLAGDAIAYSRASTISI
jgi:hypothetical protein